MAMAEHHVTRAIRTIVGQSCEAGVLATVVPCNCTTADPTHRSIRSSQASETTAGNPRQPQEGNKERRKTGQRPTTVTKSRRMRMRRRAKRGRRRRTAGAAMTTRTTTTAAAAIATTQLHHRMACFGVGSLLRVRVLD